VEENKKETEAAWEFQFEKSKVELDRIKEEHRLEIANLQKLLLNSVNHHDGHYSHTNINNDFNNNPKESQEHSGRLESIHVPQPSAHEFHELKLRMQSFLQKSK